MAGFINCQSINVSTCPRIKFFSVEADPAFADWKLAQFGAGSAIKLVTAKAKVGGRITNPDESRGSSLPLQPVNRLRSVCAHRIPPAPASAGSV